MLLSKCSSLIRLFKQPPSFAAVVAVLFSAQPVSLWAASPASTPLSKIDHIIVIYQENWSFDALYGSFPGANGLANASAASLNQIDRMNGNSLANETGSMTFNRIQGSGVVDNANTNSNPGTLNDPPQPLNGSVDTRFNTDATNANSSLKVTTLAPFDLTDTALAIQTSDKTGDIVHRYWNEQLQIAGAYQVAGGAQAGGSDATSASNKAFLTWSDNPGLVLSHFDATNLPEGQLAQSYTMCDNFFHSAFGGSFLNHQFLVSATAPVYYNMPTTNNNNIAFLDTRGQLVLNSSGTSVGKVVRDGNITPVAGDQLPVTYNGVAQTVTANSVAFKDGSSFDRHYAVNTIFSANLQSHGGNPTALNLLPTQNDSNPNDTTRPYIQTIGDQLDAANISWKWYSGGWNEALESSPSNPVTHGTPNTVDPLFQWHHQPFAFFDNYAPFTSDLVNHPDGRNPRSAAHLQDEDNFFSDVENRTLPAVSFIKPVGPDNEHPGYADLQRGQEHVAKIVQAVQSQPALWNHTLIVVTYDEHGGRFDHVTPPSRDIWGPGVRVPAIVISPWAKRGFVDHTQYDTSSILATIEKRFGLSRLNSRVGAVPTLENALTKDRP